MIQIESVQIRDLRGIRELEVEPNRGNFVVSGPNGSGKSGIVDAIQFALTGAMSRLTGKGTGGLSVHRHGPHVDRRDDPAAAEVSLRFYVPELQKSAVLTRNVKNANKARLEPDDPEIRAVVEEVADHPELTLSRREIIKYIIVEAGQRSKEIQALLKLEEIGQTRGVLKTVSNKLSIEAGHAERAVQEADDALRRHLDTTSLVKEDILAAVNPHWRTLSLAELADLTAETDLSAGVLERTGQGGFNKESALRDVDALEEAGAGLASVGTEEVAGLIRDLATLESDPALLEAVTRRSFIESGLALVGDTRCPLCDTDWEDGEALKAHLRAKLARADEAKEVRERLLENGAEIARQARRIAGLVEAVQPLAKSDGPDGFGVELQGWLDDLRAFAGELDTVEEIAAQRDRFEADWAVPPPSLGRRLEALKVTVQAKPDQSASMAAQTFLTRAQDRFVACQSARREGKRAARAVGAGRAVYSAYCDVADAYLSDLYEAVEDNFAEYYRAINAEDEGEFTAKLDPAESGLDLEVAFYDKGMFPPGAYHSEGHQDGMGVCLYLALMMRLLGDRFRFAVLDDVVMSVDHGHRKEFCRLLNTHFPDTQFIITTHDKVWAKQMQTEGLVGAGGVLPSIVGPYRRGPLLSKPPASGIRSKRTLPGARWMPLRAACAGNWSTCLENWRISSGQSQPTAATSPMIWVISSPLSSAAMGSY